ncbi:hypothetical protein ACJQ40_002949 [Enterococcus faecium]
MNTYEERKRAVDLYFEYDQALTATTKKLGSPSVMSTPKVRLET